MPRSGITADALASIMMESVDEVWADLLTISHDDFPAPVRITNYNSDIVSNGLTFTACNFESPWPDEDPERFGETVLLIDNVGGWLTETIRAVEGEPDVQLVSVLVSAPDTDQVGPFYFKWKTTDIDLRRIRATLAYEDTQSEPIPWQRFTPRNNPGLFA